MPPTLEAAEPAAARALFAPEAGFGEKLSELLGQILREQGAYVGRIVETEQPGELVWLMVAAIALLSGFYGLVMGALGGKRQALASALKTPVLFLLPLAICLPFLHVMNVLMGAKLAMLQTSALILFAVALHCAILASFAPIAGFFSFSGSGYHFMRIMHVGAFALCGAWAAGELREGLALARAAHPDTLPALRVDIFNVWIVVYGLVGMQMAWALRPFLGAPSMPFELFRERVEGRNFYTAVWESLSEVLGVGGSPEPEPEPAEEESDPDDFEPFREREPKELPGRPPAIALTEPEFKHAIVAALRREPPSPQREAAMADAAWQALSKRETWPANKKEGLEEPKEGPDKEGSADGGADTKPSAPRKESAPKPPASRRKIRRGKKEDQS